MSATGFPKYLIWLSSQPCTDLQYEDAHKKRQERIDKCFEIYDRYLLAEQMNGA